MGERLKDRVSMVTGSGQGMGLVIAKALHGEGARVVIVDIVPDLVRSGIEALGFSRYERSARAGIPNLRKGDKAR